MPNVTRNQRVSHLQSAAEMICAYLVETLFLQFCVLNPVVNELISCLLHATPHAVL